MRVLREFEVAGFKVSIFNWNEKYLVKYEAGALEQTYKVNEYDVLNEGELIEKVSDAVFVQKVSLRFEEMAEDWFPLINS